MKGILCACLLVPLQWMSAAQAYEADVHYSTTYVLARAAGWPEADALTIASANEAVDENQDTVAALEVDTTPSRTFAAYVTSSLHQADKNLRLHCFSETRGPAGHIAPDVLEVIAAHFAEVPDGDDDPRSHARRLIALGTALHCQQDAYSHAGFGGSCGSYPGSCYGHSYQTFFDQVVFGVLRKHHFNPDHPGVSGPWLLQALQGTAHELAVRRPKSSWRPISMKSLAALSDDLRESGLELPDDVRRDCNRYVAGKWLFEFLRSASATQPGPDALERLAPQVARTCENASLASTTVVRIPAPRYPRLKADASPWLVRADGSYQQAGGGELDVSPPRTSNYTTRNARVQLSHWSQLLALPRLAPVAARQADHQFNLTAYLPLVEPVPPL